jgi:3-dehydroquinate synthase
MERLTVKTPTKRDYDIVIDVSFDALNDELKRLEYCGRKALIVTDSIVGPIYLDTIKDKLSQCDITSFDFTITAGESSKTKDNSDAILERLTELEFKRSDICVALGGGVVGDLAGYAVSQYRRGLPFIQIPTTLLAMCDSSVGGKNGVDYNSIKNVYGTFYFPTLVYMNTTTLTTLDERQFYNGFAEAMKSAIIKDEHYYEWLIDSMYEICDRDPEALTELVYRSVNIKRLVVEKDPYEDGDRALLNFGHTLGHAIESYKMGELVHGECVALGMVAAAHISYKKEMISLEEYLELRDMLVPFNLPITVENIDIDEIIRRVSFDKKQDQTGLKFILLKKIGKAVIDRSVTVDEMREALKEIEYTESND